MCAKQIVFKADEIERLQNKIKRLGEDTNQLYMNLRGQSSNWSGIPLGGNVQHAQNLVIRLTAGADKLEDAIRKTLQGVERLQGENKRTANQWGQQLSGLERLFGLFGRIGSASVGRIPIPSPVQNVVTNLIQRITMMSGRDELNQDGVVQKLQSVIRQPGISVVEKLTAQTKLSDIYAARDQIAKAQAAYDVYKAFGNKTQMEAMHKLAEEARRKLEAFGVNEIYYQEGKNLTSYFKKPAVQACDYDPSITTASVPLVKNESYQMLLRMAMEQGDKGKWAKSQLDEIHQGAQDSLAQNSSEAWRENLNLEILKIIGLTTSKISLTEQEKEGILEKFLGNTHPRDPEFEFMLKEAMGQEADSQMKSQLKKAYESLYKYDPDANFDRWYAQLTGAKASDVKSQKTALAAIIEMVKVKADPPLRPLSDDLAQRQRSEVTLTLDGVMNGKGYPEAKKDLEKWYNRIYTDVKSTKDFEGWYERLTDPNPQISEGARIEFMTNQALAQTKLDAEVSLAAAILAIVSMRTPTTGSQLGIVPGGGFGGKGGLGGKGVKISETPPTKSGHIESPSVSTDKTSKTLKELEDVKIGGKGINGTGNGAPVAKNNFEFANGFDGHIINAQGIVRKGNKGVVGGHNLESFEKILKDQGWNLDDVIVSRTPHPTVPGLFQVQYRLPALDRELKVVPGQYKNIPHPKTVYDPNVISNDQMIKWGKEAMENGEIVGREIRGTASNGLKFTGYLDGNGKVTNFFPTISE